MDNDPPLLRLPQELLLRISAPLTTPDLGAFRRTCKHVEAYLFDSFAFEFFRKRSALPTLEPHLKRR